MNCSNCIKFVLVLAIVISVSGCASAPEPNQAVELAVATAIGDCHKAQATIETARIAKINDPRDLLLDRAIKGLSDAAGKTVDPCRITTNNDLQKVAMEENTKQIGHGADFAKSAAGNLVVGLGVWKGLDVLPELFKNAGGSTSLTSAGSMTVSDSIKTSNMGDIVGTNQLGGILNPSTTEPFVVEPLVIMPE